MLIIPNMYLTTLNLPLIFLAGPIQGAQNWHEKAINLLFSKNSNLIIVTPKHGISDEISQYIVNTIEGKTFSEQRAYERYYMDIASKSGVILFWLPGEVEHNCDKVYSAGTRIEIGMSIASYRNNKSFRFCVGTDGKFPQFKSIEYDLKCDTPEIKICSSLEETCFEALNICKS